MSPSIWLADKCGKAISRLCKRRRHYDTLSTRMACGELRYARSGEQPIGARWQFCALIRLCRTFKPDVIHAHMMSSAVFGFLLEADRRAARDHRSQLV